ncbi:glutaredoxin-related protein 5, mitochondrial [Aplysia californica]|uniref:Glutaredoxin-related protein 5, mitochondrial n=1 Tax=Aplysia californica TaxID=6500 RepID=A0ABM0K6R3_APLCA|nr:glutaredoxin-related protein 5, mitochondrial [Aplysia californica]
MSFITRQIFRSHGTSFCRLAFARMLSQEGTVNIDAMVKDAGKPIFVFMKGTPEAPRCGFSNAVCQILRFHGVDNFGTFDVLSDDDVRQGVKDHTNWPTIPQVFFNGEFIGGCDIMLDMHKNGELIDELQKLGIRSVLLDAEDGDKKS